MKTKNTTNKKRMISILIMFCMVISILPMTAFALPSGPDLTWDTTNNILRVTPLEGADQYCYLLYRQNEDGIYHLLYSATFSIYNLPDGTNGVYLGHETSGDYMVAVAASCRGREISKRSELEFHLYNYDPTVTLAENGICTVTGLGIFHEINYTLQAFDCSESDFSYIRNWDTVATATTNGGSYGSYNFSEYMFPGNTYRVKVSGNGFSDATSNRCSTSGEVGTINNITYDDETGILSWDNVNRAKKYNIELYKWNQSQNGYDYIDQVYMSSQNNLINLRKFVCPVETGKYKITIYAFYSDVHTSYNNVIAKNDNFEFNVNTQKNSISLTINSAGTHLIRKPSSGSETQTGLNGDPMVKIIYTAEPGYYLVSDAGFFFYTNGILGLNTSYSQLEISGTPTKDTVINLPVALEKGSQQAPSVTVDWNTILRTNEKMEYARVNTDTWYTCTSPQTVINGTINKLEYKVRYKETDTLNASPETIVTICANLEKPKNLRWEGSTAKWDSVENASSYDVRILNVTQNTFRAYTVSEPQLDIDDAYASLGRGTYQFQVRCNATSNLDASVWELCSDNLTIPCVMEEVYATVQDPIAGHEIDFVATVPEGSEYTATVTWTKNGEALQPGDKFEAGVSYMRTVVFAPPSKFCTIPKSGMNYAGTATINGEIMTSFTTVYTNTETNAENIKSRKTLRTLGISVSDNTVDIRSNKVYSNAIVFIGAYKNGKLLQAKSRTTNIMSSNLTSINFDDFDSSGADTVKAMVWENLSSMKPIFDAYTKKLQ